MSLKFPVIYLLPAHLDGSQIEELESQIPTLTYDAKEAEVFLGRVTQKTRVEMELRKRRINTEEVVPEAQQDMSASPKAKRQKVSRRTRHAADGDSDSTSDGASERPSSPHRTSETVKVRQACMVYRLGQIQLGVTPEGLSRL